MCESLVEREWPWKLDNMSSNSHSKAFDKLLNPILGFLKEDMQIVIKCIMLHHWIKSLTQGNQF